MSEGLGVALRCYTLIWKPLFLQRQRLADIPGRELEAILMHSLEKVGGVDSLQRRRHEAPGNEFLHGDRQAVATNMIEEGA